MLRSPRSCFAASTSLLLTLSTLGVATTTSSPAHGESVTSASSVTSATTDTGATEPERARVEPSSPLRLRLGVSPMEYGSRVVDGGDGYSIDGGWTYGLDAQALYAVSGGVELGLGGAWERTEAAGFSLSMFDALRVFATARFHGWAADGVEIGVAPRFGYAFVWADTIDTAQAPSYRRAFHGLAASLAVDARVWLTPRIALFGELDFRAIAAPSAKLDPTQGPYFASAQFWGFGVAPTFGAIFAL